MWLMKVTAFSHNSLLNSFFLSTTGYGAFFYALFPPSSNHTFHHVLTVYYDRQPE